MTTRPEIAAVGPETPVTAEPVLEISGVVKHFGGVQALDGVDLSIRVGSLTALIGPNGAGKSTLFNVITGIVAPDAGTVRAMGQDVTGWSVERIARTGVARTFQTPRGFASMTALDNLMAAGSTPRDSLVGVLRPLSSVRAGLRAKAHDVLARIGLDQVADVPYPNLSVGQARLLEIGRHLMRDVRVLLLDEPTSGVTPSKQEGLGRLISELSGDGMTIVIVEHNLGFVMPLVSSVFVMDQGRVIASGTPAEVERDPIVIAAYLGGDRR